MRRSAPAAIWAAGIGAVCLLQVWGGESARPANVAGSSTDPQVTQGIVKAPVDDVWKVFSTAEGFKKLGVAQCEMDFRIGGLILTHYNPEGVLGDAATIHNEILAYEPGHVVAFRIQKPPQGFPFGEETWKPTWTVVTLTDLGDGRTHLRIAGVNYPDTEPGRQMRKFFEAGNDWVLSHLQAQFDAEAAPSTGPAHADDPLAPVSHMKLVALSREAVWRLLATREGWRQLMDVGARIELRPGGAFELEFDPSAPAGQRGSEGCTVLSLIPGEMLSFTWNAPPKFEHARLRRTWVVVHLDEPSPGRTRVRIDHLGFREQAAANPGQRTEWEQVRAYFQRAWGKVLDAVTAHEKQG